MRSSGCVEIDRGDELGQRNVDGEVCSLPLAAPRKEKGNTGRDRNLRGVREDKGADAEVGRDCRRVEAAPTSTVAGMAGELHSGNAVATVNSFETNLTLV